MKIDRGEKIKGYYVTDLSTSNLLYGIEWLHAFPCGNFMKEDTTYGVSFFIFYKDELPDPKGKNAESLDMGPCYVDKVLKVPCVKEMLKDKFPDDLIDLLEENAKKGVKDAIKAGKKGEDIVKEKSSTMLNEFLSETFDMIPAEYIQPITITDYNGIETVVQNIRRCSLEDD